MIELLLLGAIFQINNGTILVNDDTGLIYNGTDAYDAFQVAMVNNTSIKMANGIYDFGGKILALPPNIIIEGSSIHSNKDNATSLKFDNGGKLLLSNFNSLDKVRLHCRDKTDYSVCLAVVGHDNDLGNVFVMASYQSIGVAFNQTPEKYNFDNHVSKLYITHSYQALRLQNATQNYFGQVVITDYSAIGVLLINSDHNHFDHIHLASPQNNNVKDVIFGLKQGDQTVGNTFDDLTFRTGNINLISNTYITGRPNIIQVASIDGPLKIIYQEGGKPESVIIHDKTAN